MRGAWIEDLAWPEVGSRLAGGAPVVVPVGALAKEHGHHLPMKTDWLLARALTDGVLAALPVLAAPVITAGFYPAFIRYPGSQSLSAETFQKVMEETLDLLIEQGARRLAIINTGVSTEPPITIAVRNVWQRQGVKVAVSDIRRLGLGLRGKLRQTSGGHADEQETSLILAIAPELVRMDRARADYGHAGPPTVFARPIEFSPDPAAGIDYTATGATGDPSLATVELGREFLAEMVGELVNGLRALYPESLAGSSAR
jgi:creatinine amidohydrolase